MFNVEQYEVDGVNAFVIKGRLDGTTVDEFEDVISDLSDVGEGVIVDCLELESISGPGFASLAKLSKMTKAFNKEFKLINVSDDLYYLFHVTGFTDVFTIEKSR